MTVDEMFNLLKTTGYPVAYNVFYDPQQPPYIAFIEVNSDNMFADNSVYEKINNWDIELYTTKKDPTIEQNLENVLKDFCWNKKETYLNDQKLLMITYSI